MSRIWQALDLAASIWQAEKRQAQWQQAQSEHAQSCQVQEDPMRESQMQESAVQQAPAVQAQKLRFLARECPAQDAQGEVTITPLFFIY